MMRAAREAWWVCVVLTVTGVHVHPALGACPHDNPGLRRWSDASGWPSQMKPQEGAQVVITDAVLLDESPPELGSLEIAAGASLVFSPDDDVTLTSNYVMLYGELHAGSEDCPHPSVARITLTGQRGEVDVAGLGGKFLAVRGGASLELFGQNKMSWTKLDTTIPKLTEDNGLIYDAISDSAVDSWNRGLLAFVVDGATGETKFKQMTYMVGGSGWRLANDPPKFFDAMSNVAEGDIVVMAVQKDIVGTGDLDLTPFYDAIETAVFGDVTNTLKIREVGPMDAWALIAVKGQWVKEDMTKKLGEDSRRTARVMAAIPELDLALFVESKTRPDRVMHGRSQALAATMAGGARKVNLASDATTWRPGDQLLVTSTDFDYNQAEVGEVAYCSPDECQNNQIRLLLFPTFLHWGRVSEGVDMRAEVGLLTRNVIVEGRLEDACPAANGNCGSFTYDTYGGHIQVEAGFTSVHIKGVELRNMGQLTETDRHALYFRLCSNVSGAAYVKGNTIRDSYSMCVALKATHGLLIEDNFAFNHFGHCFVLLEGGEKHNILDGNLAGGTKPISRNAMEKMATTFLITNPLTYFKNNIAAGGHRRGIWFVFPRAPIGESASLGLMQQDEARATPFLQFTNNAAHSYGDSGMYINHELREGYTYGGINNYNPRVDPLNTTSPDAEVVLHRFTGFKNRWQNVYLRGGYFTMRHASIADSARGVFYAWSSNQGKSLERSIVVGESANIGEPYAAWQRDLKMFFYYPRSLPTPWDPQYPIQGFTIVDGPLQLSSVWMNGFVNNENRTAGAIGFYPKTDWPSFQNNRVSGLSFGFQDGEESGNRVYEGEEGDYAFGSQAGDVESMLYDVDGSLTGYPDSTLIKPYPVYTTARCYTRDSWGMAACPHHYAKLKITTNGGNNFRSNPILTRDDVAATEGLTSPNRGYSQFPVITGGSHSYVIHWDNFLPETIYIYGRGITPGQSVRVGLCVPRDAEVQLYTYYPEWRPNIDRWTEVFSVEELDQTTQGGFYFWDRANGVVFVKLISYHPLEEGQWAECGGSGGHCPMVRLILKAGTASDADCRDRIAAYTRPAVSADGALTTPALAATSSTPPTGLGAGRFLPFRTRSVVDGGYGEWSDWGPCTVTCGGGSQIRSRACDSPRPQNGGAPCSGPSEDSQSCSDNPCEIHGNFSAWSVWSPCQKIDGNGGQNGYTIRTRACDDPAPRYNGNVCNGDTKEMDACVLSQ